MRATAMLTVSALGFALAACQAVLDLGDLSPADTGVHTDSGTRHDASLANDAATDARRQDSTTSDAADATAGPCPTLYVSGLSGSDSNTGCSSLAPLKSIAQAISNAMSDASTVEAIDVCAGSYTELNLSLTHPIGLHGSYDCTTDPSKWARVGAWGYPTFDAATRTTIMSSPENSDSSNATFHIGPPATAVAPFPDVNPSNFAIDGFTIYGKTDTQVSQAVLIVNGFAPTFTNNHLFGTTIASGSTPSSLASALTISRAAPIIAMNKFEFSGGTDTLAPSVGIYMIVDPSATMQASIRGNLVTAGPSLGLAESKFIVASAGMELLSGGPDAGVPPASAGVEIRDNVISAGTATSSYAEPATAGLWIAGVAATVTGNVITAAAGTLAVDASVVVSSGVVIQTGSNVVLAGNRIYGGSSSGNENGAGSRGIYADDSRVIIANNLVHGGVGTEGTGAKSSAIFLTGCPSAVIEDNTLYAGSASAGDASADNVFAITVVGNDAGALIRGNIIAGSNLSRGMLSVSACGSVAALEHNLFVGNRPSATTGGCATTGGTLKSFLSHYADATVGGNTMITRQCDGVDEEAGLCTSDCPDSGCMPWLLAGWAGALPSDGVLDAGSWSLRDGSLCQIAHGGINLASSDAGPAITDDIADAARPLDGSSVGARQYVGTCQPASAPPH